MVPILSSLLSAMLVTMMPVVDSETGDRDGIWLPLTYIFYNIVFFQVGIWTLQDKDGVLPVAVVSVRPCITPTALY